MHANRQSCPTDRQLAGDRCRACGLDVGDEPPEQALILFELEADRATQPQPIHVDARVDRGALQAAMPQHVTDPDKRHVGLDHLARRGVPQPL
jgi:hypothetical protein